MSTVSNDVKAPASGKDRSMLPILSAVSLAFVLAIIVSIYSLAKLARENTKEVDTMLTYRIYDSISSSLNEPIIVARTMACDELLSDFLQNEDSMREDEAIAVMQKYLSGIKGSLDYDSAFLVSESTHRYYTYEGLNKIVDPVNDDHDIWYSIFIDRNKPYDLDVDSDEVNKGVWTVFVNARIEDEEGNLLGVCGVGVQMTNLQEMFLEAEKEYNVKINLVDSNGLVQVDTEDINIENAWLDADVLSSKEAGGYSYQITGNNEFAVSKYVEYLGWYLVVRSAPTSISSRFFNIILLNVILFLLVMGILILLILFILKSSKKERDAREKLLIVSERAVAASEAKSSFLSSMSHEIRTPINAVLGMNEMIYRESDDKKILEYSSNIRNAGKTLLTLINSILDFSKIEEGKMEIVPVDYDTSSLIGNIMISTYERAEAKGLELITEIDENLPSRLNGDDVRILQVVMNLLSNAVKYTEQGHVRLTIRENQRDGEFVDVFFSVEDTGIGIKDEDLPRLFESFERLDEVKNHGIEGTGLGMSIVTNLLKMMGSEIRVESEYGKGSTFYFVIRQKIVDPAPMGDRTDVPSEALPKKEKLHVTKADVLVVDDNGMNLKVAENLLGIFGIKAETAHSGEDALKKVRTKRYNLILLDHMMPKMDGIETLEKMREDVLLYRDTKVVALTANAINGAREEYIKAGFDGYLSKPIEVSALEDILRNCLPEKSFASDDAIEFSDDGEIMEFAPAGETFEDADSEFVDWLGKAGFETKNAMTYCGGDAGFYRELLDDYITYRDEKIKELDTYFEEEDWKGYSIRIHALKSVSKTIGATKLAERALELEKASKEGDAEFVRSNYPDFLKAYEAVTEIIRKAIY